MPRALPRTPTPRPRSLALGGGRAASIGRSHRFEWQRNDRRPYDLRRPAATCRRGSPCSHLPTRRLKTSVNIPTRIGPRRNPPYPTAAEARGISGRCAAAYPTRHGSAQHHKRRYCSRVSLSALRTIGIEASASRTRRSRGGMPGTTSASDAASIPCRVAAHTWTA
jgi:hypothetical protein